MDIEPTVNLNRNLNLTKTFILFFVLLVPLLVVSELINRKIIFKQKATGGNPSFSFNPPTLTINPDQEFLVEVKINTAGQQTSGASVQIVYDQNIFEALEIIPGVDITQTPPMFPTVLRNKIDNPNGKVYLDAGVRVPDPQYYSGEGIFGKIKFKVANQVQIGNQPISFFLTNPTSPNTLGDCDLVGSGDQADQDLLAQVNNLTVTISSSNSPTPTNTPPADEPTATPTLPNPTPGACFSECNSDDDCDGGNKCLTFQGTKRCLLEKCPAEVDCGCNSCWEFCTNDWECPIDLKCLAYESGSRRCVKEGCPGTQDCSCTPTATATPPPIPTNTLTPNQPTDTPLPSVTSQPTLGYDSPNLIADISGPDETKDRQVNLYDFNAIMVHWEETQNIGQYDVSGPQNLPDGKVDFYDLIKVMVFWSP